MLLAFTKKEFNYKTNKALRIAQSDTNRVGDTTVVIQCGLQ